MELTTPLAITESFPATERTPILSCDMSGALGSMLVRRYELPVNISAKKPQTNTSVVDFMPWEKKTQLHQTTRPWRSHGVKFGSCFFFFFR